MRLLRPMSSDIRCFAMLLMMMIGSPLMAFDGVTKPSNEIVSRSSVNRSAASQTGIGTVIYTRAEREVAPATTSSNTSRPAAAATEVAIHRFDGYTKSERGPPVVWVNGQSDTPLEVLHERGGDVLVRVNQRHGQLLKPGQTDVRSEFAEGNSIVLHRSEPATADHRLTSGDGPSHRVTPRRGSRGTSRGTSADTSPR